MLTALRNAKSRIAELEARAHEPIAVVGIGCRFPGGRSPETFWATMAAGADMIREVPESRLLGPWPEGVPRWAGLLDDEPDRFDAAFFGISPREAQSLDPQQRLLLEVSWEALENAGFVPERLHGSRTGVYVGLCFTDYRQRLRLRPIEERDAGDFTGNLASTAAGRLSYVLGLRGPAVTVDTACSSSLVSVHLACQSLRDGEIDLALAGGVNLILSERTTAAVALLQALSPEGRCKTFDASANGFVRGEGAGVVVLKRLSDAQRDGDTILALVRGSAVNQDGRSTGLTAPNVLAQEALLRDALRNARVEPHEVGFIECHGTGTSLGDPIETDAIRSVFGAERKDGSRLWLGALKTNIGHLEAAAGIAGFIKVVLALGQRRLPPNLHLRHLNPRVRIAGTPLAPLAESIPWSPVGNRRLGGVSSFGLSGTNAHVLLEEAPAKADAGRAKEPAWLPFLVSGRSAAALKAQAARLGEHVEAHPASSLTDVAYSLATRRTHFEHRAVVIAEDRRSLGDALSALARGERSPGLVSDQRRRAGKLALLFTGQGSQYAGMGRALYETYPVYRETFDAVCSRFDGLLDEPLSALVLANDAPGDRGALHRTQYTQPALFALEVSLYALLASWGVKPDVLAGHSIGEIVAAHVAGVFSLDDACALVAARARLMGALPEGGAMVALQATEQEVLAWLPAHGGRVDIAAQNGPEATVIAGDEDAVLAVEAIVRAMGRKTTRLSVSHAFHSPRMDAMLEAFRRAVRGLEFRAPRIPLVSNVTGKRATAEELCSAEYWVAHARRAVRWHDGMRTLEAEGVGTYLELGPQGVLSGLGPACLSEEGEESAAAFFPALRKNADGVQTLLSALAGLFARGVDVDWAAFFAPLSARPVALPTYAFQRERYWLEGTAAQDLPRGSAHSLDEAGFWEAVERGDFGRVSAVLGVDDGGERLALDTTVSVLSRWRQRLREQSALDSLRYRIEWKPLDPPEVRALEGTCWLVLGEHERACSVETILREALEERGVRVESIVLSDADADRERIAASLRAGRSDAAPPRAVFSLLSLDERPAFGEAALSLGSIRALALAQALGDIGLEAPLFFVTSGAVSIGRSDRLMHPVQALSWGLGRVFALEHPERWGGLVDIAGPLDAAGRARLVAALFGSGGEDQIAVRRSATYACRLGRAPRQDEAERPAFRPRGTVLVTGGTGSIGSEVGRWLARLGAEHIVLTSRRGADAPGARELGAELEALGAKVTLVACDVAERAEVDALVRRLDAEQTPIRSVFHAAGVTNDTAFAETNAEELRRIVAGKAAGAWHLHEALAAAPLDAFVVFSSVAGVLGNGHQGAYAAANAFLDALVEHRVGSGLTGLSIAWGMWGGAGMAAEASVQEHLRRRGFRAMAPVDALRAMQRSLEHGESAIVVADIDWSRFAPWFAAARPRALLAGMPEASAAMDAPSTSAASASAAGDLLLELRSVGEHERKARLVSLVLQETAIVLGHKSAQRLDPLSGFMDLGLDSLMAVGLRQRLRRATGVSLPATLAFDHPSPDHVARFLLDKLSDALGAPRRVLADAAEVRTTPRADDEPIAIVGVGLDLPGGSVDLSTLFGVLSRAEDTLASVPTNRWGLEGFYDPDPDAIGKSYVKEAAFVERVDRFDAAFFGLSPREAKSLDPQHRLLLEATWRALEDAGVKPFDLKDSRTGVFVGMGPSEYERLQDGVQNADAHALLGTHASFAAGRIAFILGLQGPALSVDTACSSSLVALHLACRALRSGECDVALAAGVQVMAAPESFVLLSRTRALAPDGRSKPFSAKADGYGRGEGVVVLALERLSDAREHGRTILAVVRGSAVNHDGASSALTAPNGTSQQKVLRAALEDAGLSPADIDVVECHGTGTSLGDPIEVQALSAVYGQGRPKEQPLLLGAVKSNLGHLESAAGLAGVAKVLSALRHDALPPTLHTTPRNPHIDWDALPVRVTDALTPWPRRTEGRPRRAAVSAFGLSGTNAHVILEEPPAEDVPALRAAVADVAPLPFLISGASVEALRAQAARLGEHLATRQDEPLLDVAHSLANSRTHFAYRAAVVAEDRDALVGTLGAIARAERPAGVTFGDSRRAGKLAVLFTGQGSQHAGMGKQLYEAYPVFRDAFDACAAFFDRSLDRPLREVLFAPEGSADAARLDQTAFAQPALFAVEVALYRLVSSWGVRPDLLSGHSIGELSAAHVAGVFSLEDACTIVAARGRLMQELPAGGAMIALQASEAEVLPWLDAHGGRVDIAALNGPMSTVIAGDEDAVTAVAERAIALGRKTTRLVVSHAFHSPRIAPMLDAFRRVLQGVRANRPTLPIISNVTGKLATDEELCNPEYWVRHVRHVVRWFEGVRSLEAAGVTNFLELGPKGTLSGLGPDCLLDGADERVVFIPALRRGTPETRALAAALGGIFARGSLVDWQAFFAPYAPRRVVLPTYAFQHDRYWLTTPSRALAASGAGEPSAVEARFWDAVESEDADAVHALLGVDEATQQASLAAALPSLRRWRRTQAEKDAALALRYHVTWKPLPDAGPSETRGTWLVVVGDEGARSSLAEAVERALREHGGEVVRLVLGDGDVDRRTLSARITEVSSAGVVFAGVVSLLSLDEAPSEGQAAMPRGLVRTLSLAQALLDVSVQAPLWVVTSGAVRVGRSDRCERPLGALSWGLGRVFGLEHPERWGGLVDVAGPLDERGRARLAGALVAQNGETEIALRSSGRYARRITRASREDDTSRSSYEPRGTILITGGTGALGAEVARWLAKRGATHLVLASRRGGEAPGAAELAAELGALGTRVTLAACDVADRGSVAALVEALDAAGSSIRAVFHTAGVVKLAPFAAVASAELASIVSGKAAGALHLHELLSERALDAFVVFSSIAGVWGSAHQAAYAAANTFLDALMEHRRQRGLAGTSIAWGMWDGSGMASDEAARSFMERRGVRPMAPPLALFCLDRALRSDDAAVTVADIDWPVFAPLFAAARTRAWLDDLPDARAALATEPARGTASDEPSVLCAALRPLPAHERVERMVRLVLVETAAVLGHADAEALDTRAGFMDLGVDSLMAVELRRRLRLVTGLPLPVTLTFDHPSPHHVALFLLDGLAASLGQTAPQAVDATAETVSSSNDEPIAIIGIGLRLPGGGVDLSTFFRFLAAGDDAVAQIPADRWDVGAFYDPNPEQSGKSYVREAALLDRIDLFDASFFGISPREAKNIDPQHRLLLEASWEALEDAGRRPGELKDSKTGVFVGIGAGDYGLLHAGAPDVEAYTVLGTNACFAAGRVAFTLGLQGPALSVDTACSSSLVALHLACRALRNGECDTALAAGVQVIAAPEPFVLLSRTRALAPDGRSKTFSAAADGYGRGEGVVVLALERLADARRHGRNILAVLRGSAVNHDGASSGITAPNGTSQQKVLRAALDDARLAPSDVDVIECHGTGTSLGDPIEVQALSAVYGAGRSKEEPLLLGAVKTNVGHLESAAGITGVVKMIAALRHGVLPPTLHTTPRNPHIDWDSLPVRVVDTLTPWPRRADGRPRRAAVSAFGLSGTNAHVILEEPPAEELPPAPASSKASRPLPLLLSGKTLGALQEQAARLRDHVEAHPELALADVAHSLANGRTHFEYRAAVVAEERSTLVETLGAIARAERPAGVTFGEHRKPRKLAFLFTGQGSQHPRMGKQLSEAHPVFRDALEACCAHFDTLLDRPLLDVLFAPEGSTDAALLDQTLYTQPALFALEVALHALVTSWGLRPDVLWGHSIGEIVAAHVAGVMTLEDACAVVAARARLMQELPPGGAMISLQASEAEVLPLLVEHQGRVDIASLNGPAATVIAGDEDAALAIAAKVTALGRKATRLAVSHAFHSPRMAPMLDAFQRVVEGIRLAPPSLPIISDVTGKRATEEELTSPAYWVRHVRHAVRWLDGMKTLEADGVSSFLELGPRGVLCGLGPDCLSADAGARATFFPALRKDTSETRSLVAALAGLFVHGHAVDWQAFFAPISRRLVALPTYAFQRERHWIERPRGRLTSLGAPAGRYPLSGVRTDLPDGSVLHTVDIGPGVQPYLTDHVVYGRIVIAGAFYLTILLAIAESHYPDQAIELRQVHFARVLAFAHASEHVTLHVQLTRLGGDAPGFSVVVCTRKDDEWTTHVTAVLAPVAPSAVSPRANLSPPSGDATPDEVSRLDAMLRTASVEFGARWWWLRRLDATRDRVGLGRFEAPEGVPSDDAPLPGGLVDNGFAFAQWIATLSAEGRSITRLPFAVDRFVWYGRRAVPTWVEHAILTENPAEAEVCRANLTFWDAEGAPVAHIDGFTNRRAPEERLLAGATSRDLFVVSWVEPQAPAHPPRPAPASIALLGAVDPAEQARLSRAFDHVSHYVDVDSLRAALDQGGDLPRHLLFCVEARPETDVDVAAEAHAATNRAVVWLQAILADARLAEHTLVVLTKRAVAAQPDEDVLDLAHAPLWGLVRTARIEHPDRVLAIVDIDESEPSLRALPAALSTGEIEFVLRDGVIRLPRLARASAPRDLAPISFPPGGTVLVTGGTGALGAEVARHLVEKRGVDRLLLVSQRGPEAKGAGALLEALRAAGAVVTLVACDVSDRHALKALLDGIPDEHPLTAVIHTAGVLDDGVLLSLTPERTSRVLRPKVDAALALHELTLGHELSAFVVFSSLTGLLGNAGQASYAAANTFLDALAARRRASGRRAVSLAYGPWAEGGMAARLSTADRERMRRRGFSLLSKEEGLALLDAALGWDAPLVVGAHIDVAASGAQADGIPEMLRGLVRAAPRRNAASEASAAPTAIKQRLVSLSEPERERVLVELVRKEAAAVLGAKSQAVDPDRPLQDLGLDSLMAIELRNRLGAETGLRLPATLLFDHPTPTALAKLLRSEILGEEEAVAPVVAPSPAAGTTGEHEPIAIIGIGCRYPGGVESPEDLWRLVREGTDAIGPFPSDRGWDVDAVYDPDPEAKGKIYVREGGFLRRPDLFDPGFFGLSPREAIYLDPQQRLMLETSQEAIERAGIDVTSLNESPTGVFVGVCYNDYELIVPGPREAEDAYPAMGTSTAIASGRIAYTFGLQGPTVTVDTACSSSLVAIHLACQALRNGECSLALAGGATVFATPEPLLVFARMKALSPDGRCRAFSADANGAGWGEGAGMLLLERLSDAIRNNHPILALVRSSALNQDGRSQGLTAPNGPSQRRVIRQALAAAKLSPGEIDAIEAHGTGTPLGDPIEAEALLGVYGRSHSSEAPLWLGTLKSNIGHTQAAAGVGGVIKMVLAMQNDLLPRTLHADPLSQHIDWSSGSLRILAEAVPWKRNGRPRRAGVSSFGVSGTNAHVIIEEAPFGYETAPLPATAPSRSLVLPLSGKTERALRMQAERLAGHLASHPEMDLADVAFSLATTRAHLEHRAAIVARERESAREALDALAAGRPDRRAVQGRAAGSGRVVFVFPGQGSQWAGMAVPLLETSDVFRASIEACERALAPHVDWSLGQVLRGEAGAPSMDRMDVVQPVLFAVMVSLAALWRSFGVEPDAVVGHSQGEMAAAYVAGGLSLEDAARVVALRSRALMKVAGRGAMASVELPVSALAERLHRHGGLVEVAAINGPTSTVVSGETAAIDALLAELEKDSIFARKVRVDFASHCAQVDPLREELLEALAPISPRRPTLPFHSTVDVGAPSEGMFDAAYWYRNLRSTVRFAEATRLLLDTGHRVFIEVSPHPVLNLSLQASLDAAEEVGVVIGTLQREEGGFDRMLSAFAELHAQGVAVDWARVLPPARKVLLPTYAFQRERYWSSVRAARGAEGGPATAQPIDQRFWAAVERADVEALAGSLGLVDDSQRASLAAVLPALSTFHGKSRERDALDACRYRIAWRPWTSDSKDRLQGRWLLVVPPGVEKAPLEVAVERALVDGGAEVVVVRLADDAMDVAALAAALSNAMGQGASPGGVVSLVPQDGEPREAAPGLPRCAASAFTLLQAFVEAKLDVRLWLVTSGAVSTGPNDPLRAPEQALVWGLGRAISMEHPSRVGGLIDVARGLDGSVLARLVSVLGHGGGEDQFALRSDGIRVRRLVRAPLGNATAARAFEPSGAVLVTGGTGALGSEVARWLAKHGARHLVLTSRRGGDTPGAASLAAELEGLGARVTLAACDTQDRSALSALVDRLESEGTPIRAVFHAAGVSHQKPLVETSLDAFAGAVSGKAIGAWRVHEVFAGRPLDVFVMFASIAGVWGSANQGAYAAANAFLDALAEHRRGLGLAGTSIAWGLWEGRGMGADEVTQDRLRRLGIGALPIGRALQAMQEAIEHDEANVTVADVNWTRFVPSFTAARPRPLLAELPEAQKALEAPVEDRREAGSEPELLTELQPLTERERLERLVTLVRNVTGSVLGHADGAAIDARAGFTNLGLDSLMALELRRRLERATGVKLPATLAFDHPSPHRAAAFLAKTLQQALHEEKKQEPSVSASDLSDQEIRKLLGRVSISMLRKGGLLDALLSLAEPGPAEEAPSVAVTDLEAFDDDALIAAASSLLEEK
ncbi:type I polyketide synthase [Polyangium sp. y55x31]|uniref:type I polyketide synthase n=1 Tax=Polyangium sp. y55x31 TaxID=3042688 RepID=UPI0024824076|nr:type I polyketide synthase [Polyangium sp. y55x31]MDI1475030.1 SDR family NAD(P)-dependent oxidoreductase [Polyangium sp. y55x31]